MAGLHCWCRLSRAVWSVALLGWSCCLSPVIRADDQCYGPLVLLQASNSSVQCRELGSLASFGSRPPRHLSEPVPLLLLRDPLACEGVPELNGAAVIVERGGCNFTVKALNVQRAGGVVMLLYNQTGDGCITMGADYDDPNAKSINIVAISLLHDFGELLSDMAPHGGAYLSIQSPPVWDANAVVLWVMAVGTVLGGSIWAGRDYVQAKGREKPDASLQSLTRQHAQPLLEEAMDISAWAAVGFVAVSSVVLLVLFFYLDNTIVYILIFGFCFAGSQALCMVGEACLGAAMPGLRKDIKQLPCLGPMTKSQVMSYPLALVLCMVWAVYRKAPWSWLLQDLIGISLMLFIFRVIRISSIRVACILLPLCFFYDVFWVIIQPHLFGNGESVMVRVAKGGGTHEHLPMLLRVPPFTNPYMNGYSMLGFGDIMLPGLLVAFTHRLDLDHRPPFGLSLCKGYFVPTLCGYGAGLMLTYVALVQQWGSDQGQPALLYLVPCTLGLLLLMAAWRGELSKMFQNGKWALRDVQDHDSDHGDGMRDMEASVGGDSMASQVVQAQAVPSEIFRPLLGAM